MLEEKVQRNISYISMLEEKIEKVVEANTPTYKLLHQKADPMALEHFSCVLTCCDYLESLVESDVLCLSMNVTRSEVAIADPTKIRINDIFETVVSGR